ncbi:hypothetical protein [Acinetobacter sp.]|uniref:hypothetical protein n=1 Tax=Acinetobacter sp. TaxID=472 RepID=UPI003D00631E
MEIIDVKEEVIVKGVKFPVLNKNADLSEYIDQLKTGKYKTYDVLVKRKILCGYGDYVMLANDLLENRPEIWGNTGGFSVRASEVEQYGFDKYDSYHSMPENLQKLYSSLCMRNVTKVINIFNGEHFYVDVQGYEYARYVGF